MSIYLIPTESGKPIISQLMIIDESNINSNNRAICPFHNSKDNDLWVDNGFQCHSDSCNRKGLVKYLSIKLAKIKPERVRVSIANKAGRNPKLSFRTNLPFAVTCLNLSIKLYFRNNLVTRSNFSTVKIKRNSSGSKF